MVYFDFDNVLETSSIDSSYSSREMNLIFSLCGSSTNVLAWFVAAGTQGHRGPGICLERNELGVSFLSRTLGIQRNKWWLRGKGPLSPALPTLAAVL